MIMTVLLKLYSSGSTNRRQLLRNDRIRKCFQIEEIHSETCFYLQFKSGTNPEEFIRENWQRLNWLLLHDGSFHVEGNQLRRQTKFETSSDTSIWIEVGPRPTIVTPFSTNAVSAFRAAGLLLERVEHSRRYLIKCEQSRKAKILENFEIFGDKMTECFYDPETGANFFASTHPSSLSHELNVIDLSGELAMEKLSETNQQMGLGFDEEDLRFYYNFFRNKLRRNPTDVELFDMAQSNSEHSRHWFFKGRIRIDGVERFQSLFSQIQQTQHNSNPNNVIAFSDNSSAIHGFTIPNLLAEHPDRASRFVLNSSLRHILYTAETHNFPTGVCPFPGAATGVGGRIRDVQATGRGAHEIAGVAGYAVGNLNLPDFKQEWEADTFFYPENFAPPSKILLEASDGASDYGNKFGEPLIVGFTRSFGMRIPFGKKSERVEYIKPIMFSGGVGTIDEHFITKKDCQLGQIVAKIGGPIYRIGVGGGAASSLSIQGDRDSSIDYGAVQRGDPEMEQKLHRVIRSCIELGDKLNPILSIHDQGAGGNGNVLKEIVESRCGGGGATIHADRFELGDTTISALELWTAEYQESDAILLNPDKLETMESICRRERCKLCCVGEVRDDGRVILKNFGDSNSNHPVDLNLNEIAEREQKIFAFSSFKNSPNQTLNFTDISLQTAIERVLRLPTVACKRFLTSKVDRSVTGLIAQQQCVGPLQTPLANVGVVALSLWQLVGAAVSVGEQPIKGLIDPGIGARMSVGEALTNLVFAPITSIRDIKCSGNWMWAAKVGDEGARLVAACDAMCKVMGELGIAVDGGKDSLSMAAMVANPNNADDSEATIVKAPGTLVISAYAPCTNITRVLTPDFKPKDSTTILFHLKMTSTNQMRLGGSALAQCFGQIGGDDNQQLNLSPDMDDPAYFLRCFQLVQRWLLLDNRILLSGHDVSDGGLLTTILEGAFAGNCSVRCHFEAEMSRNEVFGVLFGEELGLILEVEEKMAEHLLKDATDAGVLLQRIGECHPVFGSDANVSIYVNSEIIIDMPLVTLREIWEETSDRMDAFQLPSNCLIEQSEWRRFAKAPKYSADFEYGNVSISLRKLSNIPKVAILREEGSNGDREMAAGFMMAGFEAYDVAMSDILKWAQDEQSNNDFFAAFDGLAMVGGFSYADVFGSAKGWAASIRFNRRVNDLFERFRRRKNTFSLGVCNGCQLMSLLGFIGRIPKTENEEVNFNETTIFLDENECGRFYSGFNTVRIEKNTPSILLSGMGGSILGVWCSHGEGKFTYSTPQILKEQNAKNLIALRYCDSMGRRTQNYPENPNGSEEAVAGICSADGRHLALMPHPDRSFLCWQWPDNCSSLVSSSQSLKFSPWIRLFENAFEWTQSQQKT